jgi:alpha-glucosidase
LKNIFENTCTRFIAPTPSVWDETVPLESRLGQYIAIARREAGVWYIDGMTDREVRTLNVDLCFLRRKAMPVGTVPRRNERRQSRPRQQNGFTGRLSVHLTSGGGFAGKIIKK